MTRWHIWDVVVFGDVVALVPNVWLTSSPWG